MNFRSYNITLYPVLYLIAGIYKVAIAVRNILYDKGHVKTHRLRVPVISVGNIEAGGTGKTPMVISLAQLLIRKGYRVGVLTRGYKRESRGEVIVCSGNGPCVNSRMSGDEPYVIAKSVPGAIIISDKNKTAAGKTAIDKYNCNVLIIDDGFQHRKLERDIDIVLWDGTRDPLEARIIPSGRMRESWAGLKRASIVIITRSGEKNSELASFLLERNPNLEIFYSQTKVVGLIYYSTQKDLKLSEIENKRILALCGIGNPKQFFSTIEYLSPKNLTTKTFPDHFKYRAKDLEIISEDANKTAADFIITTEKDAANLPPEAARMKDLLVLKIAANINENTKAAILSKLPPSK